MQEALKTEINLYIYIFLFKICKISLIFKDIRINIETLKVECENDARNITKLRTYSIY
jgi:hypothetical protein